MRGSRGCTVGGRNVVKPPLTLQLEDAKTQGFSLYYNTYPFNYLFGDKELLARQVDYTSLFIVTSLKICMLFLVYVFTLDSIIFS